MVPLAACAGGVGGNGGLFGGRSAPDPAPLELDAELAVDGADATGADASASGDGRVLGFTVVSLGDASSGGLWLETPLVSVEGPGRVIGENGQQISVTLRPSGGERGSGSRLSLAGFQALGIPLTSLPTVTVVSDA